MGVCQLGDELTTCPGRPCLRSMITQWKLIKPVFFLMSDQFQNQVCLKADEKNDQTSRVIYDQYEQCQDVHV